MISKIFFAAAALQATIASASLSASIHRRHADFHHGIKPEVSEPTNASDASNPYVGDNVQTRQATGGLIIDNRCSYDIWYQAVNELITKPMVHVPAGTAAELEPYLQCGNCGTSYKISKTEEIIEMKHVQAEYTFEAGLLYYDISLINCADLKAKDGSNCPGFEGGLRLASPEASCKPAYCPPNTYCPEQVYWVDQPKLKMGIEEPVLNCGAAGSSAVLQMTVCSG
ncbi:hypothetical protein BDV95DRAFT_614802 [Massariosphaeria phaeospora]|uniref:Chitin-binding type-4 domain-containing protein n=1 Tax=Massariosphaeria phaeospora TaxID=100035 RepID=A0A7C8IEK4_9PLEO|nr:hypothetical protein BDV95DRAFT_614802 [Massariosphaeria phaeospora]